MKPNLQSPTHKLFITLAKLKILKGTTVHRRSHILSMIATTPPIPPHWIPIAPTDFYMNYLEIHP